VGGLCTRGLGAGLRGAAALAGAAGRRRRWPAELGWALAFALVFSAAVFGWFGQAMGRYSGIGAAAGQGVLLLLAPLFQPQWLAWVLVRQGVARLRGPGWGALAGACAWVGLEWAWPKLLGDSLGHGLYPSEALRPLAAWGGVAGLTLLLLGVNEALSAAWRTGRWRLAAAGLAAPLLLVGAVALQGAARSGLTHPADAVPTAPAPGVPQLRIGLVQANMADLEQRRAERGTQAVLRELLDLHLAMSFDALERQGADAVLWSETVYPTTFGRPKSAAGAAFDRELLATVAAAGRPFVFGTYEGDAEGREYNAAAFVDPEQGLLGHYRKTRLFPLTESVPAWLDGPALRRWLPWVGNWQAGQGARPMPLRLRDGRELPVQALICRDAVDPALAIDAARLGAQALLTLSNDAWFRADPLGAELHLAVAAFRSVETGLPQFRVTTTGISAVIDARGRVLARGGVGERSLVVGTLPVPVPERTLMVAWGDWVGPAALALLGLMVLQARLLRMAAAPSSGAAAPRSAELPSQLPSQLACLPAPARLLTAALRLLARAVLLGLGLALLLDEGLRDQSLRQLRLFGFGVLLPELLAACLLAAWRVRLQASPDGLLLQRGGAQRRLPWAEQLDLRPWRLPLPGATLHLQGGGRLHLAGVEPARLVRVLALHDAPAGAAAGARLGAYWAARDAVPSGGLQHPALKYGLLPLAVALPAFLLHQQIAYGGWLGEVQSHGLTAYLRGLGLWWAGWLLGVALLATLLRAVVEALSWGAARWRPQQALALRRGLERAALGLLYLGLPGWLLLRLMG
jgi:apolipoprotein N-acyltransferase